MPSIEAHAKAVTYQAAAVETIATPTAAIPSSKTPAPEPIRRIPQQLRVGRTLHRHPTLEKIIHATAAG